MPHSSMSQSEIDAIIRTYEEHNGNQTQAAESLGIPRKTFTNKLNRAWLIRAQLAPLIKPSSAIPRDEIQRRLAVYEQYGRNQTKAAKALGLSRGALQDTLRTAARYGMHGPQLPADAMPPEGFVIKERTAQYDADGELKRQSIKTTREAGGPFEPLPGHAIKGESVLVDADGNVSLRWIKTRENAQHLEALTEALREAMAAVSPRPPLTPPDVVNADLMTVYPVADLHMGMMSWGKETGASYDVEIAARLALESVSELVAMSRPSKRAVILGLGDYFHQNDATNQTPRSGHVLDVDGRWPKVLRAGCDVAMAIVDAALQKHEHVDVRFLPGNHDPDAAVALSVAMSLAYRNDTRVTIDVDPSMHWYCRFGRVLMGATHGHTMKPDRMAMMLATDRAADWGETVHKHFFFGHIHNERAADIGPVKVESFRTIASKDGYAHGAGYRAPRSMSAITFHAERGEIGRHKVHVT